jgi:hypothetical protein
VSGYRLVRSCRNPTGSWSRASELPCPKTSGACFPARAIPMRRPITVLLRTSSDGSALASADCSAHDGAGVPRIAGAVLLLEQSSHHDQRRPAAGRCCSRTDAGARQRRRCDRFARADVAERTIGMTTKRSPGSAELGHALTTDLRSAAAERRRRSSPWPSARPTRHCSRLGDGDAGTAVASPHRAAARSERERSGYPRARRQRSDPTCSSMPPLAHPTRGRQRAP